MTRVRDANGVETDMAYHPRGWLQTRTVMAGGTNATTTMTYDPVGDLASVTAPDGVMKVFMADGRVASVTATPVRGITTHVVTAVTYLPFGPADSCMFGSGQTLTKTYDRDYRSTGVARNALYLQYTLDAIGNPVALNTAAGQASPAESYLYDPLSRLQQTSEAGVPWQATPTTKPAINLTKTIDMLD